MIQIDPWSNANLSKAKPGDLVLITDTHPDHLDLNALAKVRKAGAPVVIPNAAKDKVPDGVVMANGETKTVAGVQIEALPMYNLQRGPNPGELWHPKGRRECLSIHA